MLSTNANEVVKKLVDKRPDVYDAIKRGMVLGMEDFSAIIQKEQMSGRPGLQTQTGHLKGSWHVRTLGVLANFTVQLATNVIYAAVHQFGAIIRPVTARYLAFRVKGGGGKGKMVFTKKVVIPKRLRILEAFEKRGGRLISLRVNEELRRALRG